VIQSLLISRSGTASLRSLAEERINIEGLTVLRGVVDAHLRSATARSASDCRFGSGLPERVLVARQSFDGLDAIAHAHLAKEMSHVVLDGANRQAEAIGNLFVG